MTDDFEDEVRRTLHDRAAELPDSYDAPDALLARARRRRAAKVAALTLSVVLVVAGSAAAVVSVVGRDASKQVISTAPPGPTTTAGTTTVPTTTAQGPAVDTIACPVLATHPETRPTPPVTTPRVPAAGDPARFDALASFAGTPDARYIVLGPKDWSCMAQYFEDGRGRLVVYPPGATPGRVPSLMDSAIAVDNEQLWHGTSPLPCAVSTDPAVLAHAASVGMACALPAGRTLTHVDDHVSKFADADGGRGAAWMKLPSTQGGSDGEISVLTCRPTDGLTAADCDTIIADYVARVDATPPDPTAPTAIAAAPYPAGSWTATTDGIAIAEERGGGVAAYEVATDHWRTFAGPPFSGAYDIVAARGDSVFVRANPNSSSAPTTPFAALDVTAGKWRSLAPVPADVPYLATTGDADRIFGVGAFEDVGDPMPPRRTGTIAVEYDVGADRWTRLPASPLGPRGGFTTEWTGAELLVWSGGSNHQGCVPAYTDGAAYNPATRIWRSLPVAPVPSRYWAAHVWTGTELLVWSGDHGNCGQPPIRGGAAYNPATNQWRQLPPAPLRGVRAPVAVWTGQEMFVFRGGTSGEVAAAAYNPSTDSWRSLPASARAEGDAATAAFVHGRVLLALVGDGSFTGLVYPAGA